jgi:hypothetical protein
MAKTLSESLRLLARDAIEYDDARSGFFLEHHVALAAGAGLAVSALMAPSRSSAALRGIAAGFLLVRGLSGRDGARDWLQVRESRPTRMQSPEELRETWLL